MTDVHSNFYTFTFTGQRIEDVPFKQAQNSQGQMETLTLDVYPLPASFSGLRPAIIWVHGGGFKTGNDKRQTYIQRFASDFAARGFVGIAPDYRVRENPKEDLSSAVADAVTDAGSALEWLHAHASEYQIDPRRIILAGGSAGGMTVLNLVHASGLPLDDVVAVLDLWGTPWKGARLFERVNPATPPTFIVHGTADQLVSYDLSPALKAELEQAGVKVELLTLPDAPHTPMMHYDQMLAAVETFLSAVLAGLPRP